MIATGIPTSCRDGHAPTTPSPESRHQSRHDVAITSRPIPVETLGGEVLLYEAPDGQVRVDVRLDHETVWLTQEQMRQLFGRKRPVITNHVRNAFREGELEASSVCAKFAQVQIEGERTVPHGIDRLPIYICGSAFIRMIWALEISYQRSRTNKVRLVS
jgi:hypothetical protein